MESPIPPGSLEDLCGEEISAKATAQVGAATGGDGGAAGGGEEGSVGGTTEPIATTPAVAEVLVTKTYLEDGKVVTSKTSMCVSHHNGKEYVGKYGGVKQDRILFVLIPSLD